MTEVTSRRSDVRSKIVEFAAGLLRERGPAAVTTRAVAEGAGVQAPTIYRLFGDKDGLLDAVAEHVMATYASAKAAIVEAGNVDPLDDLRAGWTAQIDFGIANPSLFRLLSDPDRVRHSPAAQMGKGVLETRVHRVALTGRLRVSEERAVQLIQAAGIGTIQTLLSMPPGERDSGLAGSMYDAVSRQILTNAAGAHEPNARSAAVAFRANLAQLDMLTDSERRLLTDWLDRAIDALERS